MSTGMSIGGSSSGELAVGGGLLLGGLDPAMGITVKYFISTNLIKKKGATVRSSDMYQRYRDWSKDTRISDVRLAELFSQNLESKRVASGKIWMDCELTNNASWAGPSNTKIKTIHTSGSKKIDLVTLHITAIRNVEIGPGPANCKLMIGDKLYDLIKRRDHDGSPIWTTPRDLWLTKPKWNDIGFTVTSDSRYTMTYECSNDTPTDSYNYSNSVDKYSYEVIDGRARYTDGSDGSDVHEVDYELLPSVQGLLGVGCARGNSGDCQAIRALVCAQAKHGKSIEYAVESGVPCNDSFHYIEEVENGYVQCARYTFNRTYDGLVCKDQLNLPSGLYSATLWDKPFVPGNYINVAGCIMLPTIITYRTSFTMDSIPVSNIFRDYTPHFDGVILGDLRPCAGLSDKAIFSGLDSALGSFSLHSSNKSLQDHPFYGVCHPCTNIQTPLLHSSN